jgi:hypothetical protein
MKHSTEVWQTFTQIAKAAAHGKNVLQKMHIIQRVLYERENCI